MNKLLITGSNGLVGTRFMMDFGSTYSFDQCDISNPDNPVDITNYESVIRAFERSEAKSIVHLAAFTDVTRAWEERDNKDGLAYKINVDGTENVVKAASATGKHLIHISTAYVFDGENPDMYQESDERNPIEWYGYTKAKAEEVVEKSEIDWTILRIDQPFRPDPFAKTDTAHRIVQGFLNNQLYPQFVDHFFGPTFLPDFSKVLDWVIRTQATGVYHASSGEMWSDFEFATAIKESLNLDGEVKEGKLEDYLKTLNRPYQKNTALNCAKLQEKVDFEFTPIKEAVAQLTW